MRGLLMRVRNMTKGRNFILLVDTGVTALTNMLLVVVAARTLKLAPLSHFSLAQLVTVTTVSFLRGGLYSPAMAAQRQTGPARVPISWPATIGVPLAAVVAACAAPFIEPHHHALGRWFIVLLACIASQVLQDGARTVLVSTHRERFALISDAAVLVIMGIGWVAGLPSTAQGLLLFWGAAGIGGLLLALIFYFTRPPVERLPPQALGATWQLAKWASIDIALGSFATLLPFFVATAAQSSNSAGIYRTLQTALGPLNIVHTTVVTAFGLDAWKSATHEGLYKMRDQVTRLTVLLAAAGVVYAGIAEPLMIKISGLHDASLWRIAILMMVAATLGAANSAYNAAALALGYQRSGAVLRAVIVTMTVVISLPASANTWVPWHDPIGVCTLAAAIVTFVGWAVSYSRGMRRELRALMRRAL